MVKTRAMDLRTSWLVGECVDDVKYMQMVQRKSWYNKEYAANKNNLLITQREGGENSSENKNGEDKGLCVMRVKKTESWESTRV